MMNKLLHPLAFMFLLFAGISASKAQLGGNYTIDASLGTGGTNFQSVRAAADTLVKYGVSGPVIFNIASGTYTDQVVIKAVTGVSAVNTITFQSALNIADSVTLSYAGGTTVKLDSVNYVSFKYITVVSTGTANSMGFQLTATSSYDSIVYCKISAGNNGIYGYLFTGDRNVFNNNIITYNNYGIYLGGIQETIGFNVNYYYSDSNIIANNIIRQPAASGNPYGIYVFVTRANEIYNNRLTAPGNSYGMYILSSPGTRVINNTIYASIGLGVDGAGGAEQYFYHNTIAATGAYAVMTAGKVVGSWKNNIMANLGTGVALNALNSNFTSLDYNIYYTNGKEAHSLVDIYNGAVNYTTWKTSFGFDAHSLILNPDFVSASDLHLVNGCNKNGTAVSPGVTTDIEGNLRNVSTPTIGAYEYSASNNLAIDALVQPLLLQTLGSQDIVVRVKNAGKNPVTTFYLTYTLNNGFPMTQSWSGVLAPCDTVSVTIYGVNISSGTALTVYTSLPNGISDTYASNDTLKKTFYRALNGLYTINALQPGSATNFQSFKSATDSLTLGGVYGPVVFDVRSGTYTERVIIPAIAGTSATNTVTFKSAANHTDSVTLNFAAGNNIPVVTFNSASYINFKYIAVASTTTNGRAFQLSGTASYDTIMNCKLTTPQRGIITDQNSFEGKRNVFTYNTINATANSSRGIDLIGTFGKIYTDSNIIEKNTISATGAGISVNYTRYTKVRNNTVTLNSSTAGVLAQNNIVAMEITGNNILQSGAGAGIAISTTSGTFYSPVLIVNNSILTGTNSSAIGIASNGDNAFLNFYHNTILTRSGIGVYIAQTDGVMEWKNNLIATLSTSAARTAVHFNSNTSVSTWDYNLYYANGRTAVFANAVFPWQANGQDLHSVIYRPAYVSVTDLRPNTSDTAAWSMNGRGVHLDSIYTALVRTDVNGNFRPVKREDGVPDIGAYEFVPDAGILPPLAKAMGSLAFDSTQLFMSPFNNDLDTLARVRWYGAVPLKELAVRQYTGVRPFGAVATDLFMYFYTDIKDSGTGGYNCDIDVYYQDVWSGTIPVEQDLNLISRNGPLSSWTPVPVYSTPAVNTARNILSGQTLPSFGWFTGTDRNYTLPVQLVSLKATAIKSDIMLTWSTASEMNSNRFVVERSKTANDGWEVIGTVKATKNAQTISHYQFTDYAAGSINNSTIYYRLRMVDQDGSYQYSKVVSVTREQFKGGNSQITVYPNPFVGNVNIELVAATDGTAAISIVDITGREVQLQTLQKITQGNNVVTIDTDSLNKGIYFLSVEWNGKRQVLKLVKQ